ncbi:MAG TPA: helix-turn-helix domain-containing protein [Thermoleophilaceae bacterium]|nr:helix-turn-helix domain-containing protein [Thermoleophilaceae bacterium]
MTDDDALFGYRQQVFALAGRTTVTEACRTFGIHRSTYYRWKAQVERHGLEMLRPRERRRPQMPNALPKMVEERILSFAIAHPGLGPRRVASELGRAKWGAIVVSKNGVWRTLRRHGLSTRAKRLSLVAGYAAPYEPPREVPEERHLQADHPGELVGMDCFFVGRLRGTRHPVWQLTAIDIASSYAWAELVSCPSGHPTGEQTSRLARRVAAELARAGWALERVLCDNGGEFKSRVFGDQVEALGARRTHIHAGRPQTNGNVEALQRTILDECWRPAFARYLYVRFTGLRRELESYLRFYNTDRVHHGRLTAGRIPADIVYGARKMEA